MAQRRHHYERAFENYLRSRRIPYIAVDEAKKALLPCGAATRFADGEGGKADDSGGPGAGGALKSFDFVIYTRPVNLLVDVKGRRIPRGAGAGEASAGGGSGGARGRLESWVTREDVESLARWERLFGPGFEAAFVFVYWCESQPPDALFQEVFEERGRWYALRGVGVSDYLAHMKTRSPRWGTVDLSARDFERLSRPFTPIGECEAGLEGAREAPGGVEGFTLPGGFRIVRA